MFQDELNIKTSDTPDSVRMPAQQSGPVFFKFAIRPVVLYVIAKWKWIVAVFLVSLIALWAIFHYAGKYSKTAWTASAKVFHQARSDRIPSFYKPVGTSSVMQFINSKSVFARVASRMGDSPYQFSRSMLSNVTVSTSRTKNNIITISASASTAPAAAAIANAVAEEGVAEYVRIQNNSVKVMIDERMKQKSEILKDIAGIALEKKKLNSPVSGLSPDIELNKLRDSITSLMEKQTDLKIRLNEIDVRMREVKRTMKEIPETVQFETLVDNTTAQNLESKKIELQTLLERYTEENPKVIMLRSEIEEIQKHADKLKASNDSPSKVTYRKNSIYGDFESQLLQLGLDRTAVKASEEQYVKEIELKRVQIGKLMEVENKYADLVRRENMLLDKQTKLDDGINNLEFLISSAVPDVYVFEAASIPGSSNISKTKIKVLAIGLLIAFLCAGCIAIYRIAKFRMLDSSEYKISLGIDNLGNLPSAAQFSEKERISALQTIYQNIVSYSGDLKLVVLMKFGDAEKYDADIDELFDIAAMQGKSSFRLNCLPVSIAGDASSDSTPDSSDAVATELVSVSKSYNSGVFRYQNELSLDVAEFDLLKFDLDILAKHYDVITIESAANSSNFQVLTRLASLAKYVVIFAPFDQSDKIELNSLISQIKAQKPSPRIGGLLTDVIKPYYKA